MKNRPGRYIFFTVAIFIFYLFTQSAPLPQAAERPPGVDQYLNSYYYLAVELHQQTQIPIGIILAVAGLESQWGESELARAANNHFGIKANGWDGLTHCKTTREYWAGEAVHVLECFRKYALIRESFQDFGAFLKSRPQYNYLFDQQIADSYIWAYALQAGNYATDPTYAQKLIRVIEMYRLGDE